VWLAFWPSALVAKVDIASDAEFFAAINLDYPGLDKVKMAFAAGDCAKAKEELLAYYRQRKSVKWFVNPWERPAKPTKASATLLKKADIVMRRRFSTGTYEESWEEREIDWNYNPLKLPNGQPDTEYPVVHHKNRFGHLDTLGQAYWATFDEKYTQEFRSQIESWIRQNASPAPDQYAGHTRHPWSRLTACSPLLGAWQAAHARFLGSLAMTPEFHAAFLAACIEKARYAIANPDRVNRYQAQIEAVFNASVYFPEFRESPSWRDWAVAAMMKFWADETYPDGASKELCPGYQGSNRGHMERMIRVARLNNVTLPKTLLNDLEQGCLYPMKIMLPDMALPDFGDTWGGRLSTNTFVRMLEFCPRPEFEYFATGGARGRRPDFTSVALPWSGVYVMRTGWSKEDLCLAFDAGPLGKDHYHEDKLNFVCYAYGSHLVDEVGVYSYTSNKWRSYFRSSAAHNVVLVDGLGQNRTKAGPRTADQPLADNWASTADFDFATGEYAGGWGPELRKNLTHRRDIFFAKPDYWIISDLVAATGAGGGEHLFELLFHFFPVREPRIDPTSKVIRTANTGLANVVLAPADRDLDARVLRAQEEPLQGWYSSGYTKVEPASVACFTRKSAVPAVFDTVLFPERPSQTARVNVTRLDVTDDHGTPLPASAVCALRIETPLGTDIYINDRRINSVSAGGALPKRAGLIQFDGKCALVRFDATGKVVRACALNGSRFSSGSTIIWRQ